ncbi:MAG: 4-alpha-glucanotransferase [Lachnospiraceae bacterium]|nr:4-alpha-glucanotransferase [Lachnospiraceae bacterium]
MKKFTRGAGILLSITSLPSPYGIGTMGKEAYHFVDMLVEMKQHYWQVLPLGPTSYGDSPYQALSAFAGNPYLIDLEMLVQDNLITYDEIHSFQWGDHFWEVSYDLMFQNRPEILKLAFDRFSPEDADYQKFCRQEKEWLDDFALFMALKKEFEYKDWPSWEDEAIKKRTPEAIRKYTNQLKDEIEFYKFCQFKFFEQWFALKEYANDKGIEIIGDVPLYLALDSADVWANKEKFQLDKNFQPTYVAGCPPDAFSEDGQKWGNPLYDWKYMETQNFAWWRARTKANARLFDILRIDHFIGIVKYYSIPGEDETARDGKWIKGPGRKLTDVIDETIGEGKVIAEDLGVYMPEAKELLQEIEWPGMKILLFAFDGNTAHPYLPHNYEDTNIVVYAGTHDNETIVGNLWNKPEHELSFIYHYLNITRREEIPDAMIRMAYSSIADVVIFQMQDILKRGNETRMNFPGTIGQNWRWRMEQNPIDQGRKDWIRGLAHIFRR